MRTPRDLTQSAKDESCTLNIVGVCNHHQETTVWCHLSDGSGGSNKLTGVLNGCYGCSSCHDEIDGRTGYKLTTELQREFYMRRANKRTINRLIEKELVTVKGLK